MLKEVRGLVLSWDIVTLEKQMVFFWEDEMAESSQE